MRLESITYQSGDGSVTLPGLFAMPDRPEPRPAILVLRGVAGPVDGYSEIVERLAGWGYCALLHGWKIRGDDPPDAEVGADLAGALAFLRAAPGVDTQRLAVFGFCRGGVHALMAATAHEDIRLVVIFHGFAFRPEQARPGLQPYDLAQKVSVPTLILHGEQDERAPIEGMQRMQRRVAELKRPIDFKYYARARHGFAVRTHPGFDLATAEESFEAARQFIDQHFR
jgi:carboxymethylenebutenolidase